VIGEIDTCAAAFRIDAPRPLCHEGAVRRSYRPDGFARQLIAIQTAPSRVRKLRSVRAPTLVLHGSDDPLVPLAGGEDTAANIPGAHLRVVPGMGHFLPEALVPMLVDEIAGHCLEAENMAQSRVARAAGGSP
jgi:pimeloyl-ACP methyl ester carboxylesterase